MLTYLMIFFFLTRYTLNFLQKAMCKEPEESKVGVHLDDFFWLQMLINNMLFFYYFCKNQVCYLPLELTEGFICCVWHHAFEVWNSKWTKFEALSLEHHVSKASLLSNSNSLLPKIVIILILDASLS